MAASFTSFTGQPNAAVKLKPTQPPPRLRGSATGRFRKTGPGKPIETASYFQSPTTSFTPSTICLAVRVGPEANFRGSRSPVTRTFTCVPPTSTTKTFMQPLSSDQTLGVTQLNCSPSCVRSSPAHRQPLPPTQPV